MAHFKIRPTLLALAGLLFLALLAAGTARSRQIEVLLDQADRQTRAGNPGAAAWSLAQAAQIGGRPDLWEHAGRLALQSGDFATARAYLEKAGSHLSPQGWTDLGSAYRQAGEQAQADQAWEQAVAAGAADPSLLTSVIASQRRDGRLADALETLAALARLQPEDAQVQSELGLAALACRPELALPALERAAHLDPGLKGLLEAVRSSQEQAGPQAEAAFVFLSGGRVLASLDQWDLAVAAFRRAVESRPDYAEAWAYLGEALQHTPAASAFTSGAASAGRAELEQALRLDPRSVAAQTFTSLYWLRQGDEARALAALQTAVALDPHSPALQAQLGSLLAVQGDLEGAREAYGTAAALVPGDPAYQRLLAQFSLHHSYQVDSLALPAARQALFLDSNDPVNLDLMAQVWIQLASLDQAQEYLDRALEIDPDYAPAHLHLGLLALLDGDRATARRELELALSLDPSGPTADQVARLRRIYFPQD